MAEHLHIVCHEVPYPPDHGGLTDLFYKLKWLHKLGVPIHLHCFTSNRPPAVELESYCYSVKYYKRKMGNVSFRVPYIVSTRQSRELMIELKADDHPVLLEGIHCTWPLLNGELTGRRVFVRLHNIEHIYYDHLARIETNLLKRIYYRRESKLLKDWELKASRLAATWLPVSRRDMQVFQSMSADTEVHFIPVFTGHESPTAQPGHGEYCIYHGNLSVNENEGAASWLIREVFSKIDINLMIAGKDPSQKLLQLASKLPNVHVISNPSESSMNELLENAHIHVLPSLNKTGVKLKILNALYKGRFVLTNHNAVDGASIEGLCFLAETPAEFREMVEKLMKDTYSTSYIRERNEVLQGVYNNEMNAFHLSSLLFPHYPKPSRSQS